MATFSNIARVSKILFHPQLFISQPIFPNAVKPLIGDLRKQVAAVCVAGFHTTHVMKDLMEFFDDKKNWGEREVQVGRSWKLEELRVKSNTDLHKLWYILLKERNMLFTMEHECNDKVELFPNPERIDKVEESMKNLETVVRERNRAYFELETGRTGERDYAEATNLLGLKYKYRITEHLVPKQLNTSWRRKYPKNGYGRDVDKFLMFLKEKKEYRHDKYIRWVQYKKVCSILRRFPHVDRELLKEKFPEADINKALSDPMSRGHHQHNTI